MSRTITLNSEKSSTLKRIQEVENELAYKEEILKNLDFQITEDEAEEFMYRHAEEILIEQRSLQSILEEESNWLTVEKVKRIIKKIQDISKELTMLIKNDPIDSLPRDFTTFKEEKHMTVGKYESWYKEVYTIIYNKKRTESLDRNSWIENDNIFIPRSIANAPSLELLQIRKERFKERDYLQDDVQILKGLKEELKNLLKDYSASKELKYGFIVFIYNSIVGIVIPSMLLPYPLNTYDDLATKQLLLGLFFSELIVLFIYLGTSIYQLVQGGNLPRK